MVPVLAEFACVSTPNPMYEEIMENAVALLHYLKVVTYSVFLRVLEHIMRGSEAADKVVKRH